MGVFDANCNSKVQETKRRFLIRRGAPFPNSCGKGAVWLNLGGMGRRLLGNTKDGHPTVCGEYTEMRQ